VSSRDDCRLSGRTRIRRVRFLGCVFFIASGIYQ
jgi:hypothetical protein